jgi:SAM-dependent methyltransferase
MSPARDEDWVARFADTYWKLGPDARDNLVELLPDDWTFPGKRILDFGCGPGRMLREFLPEAGTAEFWGVDIDAPSIESLAADCSPPLQLKVSDPEPPLDFEDQNFDLIYAISVFTHLTDNSIPWLIELHRLLKPDGILIATYQGEPHSELVADEPWDEDRIGMNVLGHTNRIHEGTPMILMSEWWMRAHWGQLFEVIEFPEIHNQFWAVLKKRDVVLTAEEVEEPTDDPRELRALKHNLVQAQREIESNQKLVEIERQKCSDELARLRADFEGSLSWKLTRPLRAIRNRRR